MNVFDALENLYTKYESCSYDQLLRIASSQAEYIYRTVKNCEGAKSADNFMLSLASIISSLQGFRYTDTVYNFFVATTGIRSLTSTEFKSLGERLLRDYDVKMMIREYRKEMHLDILFDEAVMAYALAVCACDGSISDQERRYIFDFIPLPGIAD